VIIAGLLVVGLIAAIAILAILLLGRDGAAPANVVLESPANGSQVSAGSEVSLEATASGEAITLTRAEPIPCGSRRPGSLRRARTSSLPGRERRAVG